MSGDVQMQQPARAVLDHHEHEEQAKGRSDGDEEIAGDDRASVIA